MTNDVKTKQIGDFFAYLIDGEVPAIVLGAVSTDENGSVIHAAGASLCIPGKDVRAVASEIFGLDFNGEDLVQLLRVSVC